MRRVCLLILEVLAWSGINSQAHCFQTNAIGDALPLGAVARLGNERYRTTSANFQLVFFPGSKHLLTMGYSLNVWEVVTGKHVLLLPDHYGVVTAAAVAPNGKLLAVSGTLHGGHADKLVRLWDITGRQVGHLTGLEDLVVALSFSADGSALFAATDRSGILCAWDVATGRELRRTNLGSPIKNAGFTPDGRLLSARTKDGSFVIWNALSGEMVRRVAKNGDEASQPALSADGKLAAWLDSEQIHVANTENGTAIRRLKTPKWHHAFVKFSNDGTFLAALGDNASLVIWNTGTGEAVQQLDAGRGAVAAAFSLDQKHIGVVGQDHVVRVWELPTGKPKFGPTELLGHTRRVGTVGYEADGRTIVSADSGGTVCRWDARSARLIDQFKFEAMDGMGGIGYALSSNARFLTSALRLQIWDVSNRMVRRVPAKVFGYMAALSPDGRTLAVMSASRPGQVGVFLDVQTGDILAQIDDQNRSLGAPAALAFSPDGKMLAMAVQDGGMNSIHSSIVVFGLSGKVLRRFGADTLWHNCLAFSQDGKFLACGSGSPVENRSQLSLWDPRTGQPVGGFKGITGLRAVAFSPDGTKLAAAGDRLIGLWDIATGKLLRQFQGQQGGAWSLAFSPDNSRLATGGSDGTILVWEVNAAK